MWEKVRRGFDPRLAGVYVVLEAWGHNHYIYKAQSSPFQKNLKKISVSLSFRFWEISGQPTGIWVALLTTDYGVNKSCICVLFSLSCLDYCFIDFTGLLWDYKAFPPTSFSYLELGPWQLIKYYSGDFTAVSYRYSRTEREPGPFPEVKVAESFKKVKVGFHWCRSDEWKKCQKN